MIAYNENWLDALLIKNAARQWYGKGLLSDEQWQLIQDRHSSNFYSPNVFIRIGLAVFCLILLLAVVGLAFWFTEPDTDNSVAMLSFIWGVIWIMLLEFWAIGTARHYGSGIDDMLLYAGTWLMIGSWWSVLPYDTEPLIYCCITWPFLVAGAIRYLDRLMMAAAFCCSLLIVLLLVNKIPKVALYLLPFAGMVFSSAAWWFARSGQKRHTWRHWSSGLMEVEFLALISFYASGNYWVVQQAALEGFGLEQAPLAWFFWVFTFTVPALYIFMGLRHKDRLRLDVGLGCVAAMVFTYRYYFHVMPLAWAAAIGGAVLLAIAYFSIRHLRKNAGAYTYEADPEAKSLFQEAEVQIIAQTVGGQTTATPVKKDTFGGGQFGGGGASGEF